MTRMLRFIGWVAFALTANLFTPLHAATPPSFQIVDATCPENVVPCNVTIKKIGSASSKSSVIRVYTYGGSAVGGRDYVNADLQMTFTATQTVGTFKLVPIDNAIVGPASKSLTVKLQAITNARLYDGNGAVTLTDNDVAPPPEPMQTCADGTVIPASATCTTTSVYIAAPIAAGGLVRAKATCPGYLASPEATAAGIIHEGVFAGTIYKVLGWNWWPVQPDSGMNVWAVQGQTGDPAGAYIAETCLEGVKSAS